MIVIILTVAHTDSDDDYYNNKRLWYEYDDGSNDYGDSDSDDDCYNNEW